LSQILQAEVPQRYYLSKTACLGILRRAEERGKELPFQLKAALEVQAGISREQPANVPVAFAANHVMRCATCTMWPEPWAHSRG
jgi:DNA (cytosine-5)-methyltransferase 1